MNNKGFTLIELLIVVAIIGILAAVGAAVIPGLLGSAKLEVCHSNHSTIVKLIQVEKIKCETGVDPNMGVVTSTGIAYGANSTVDDCAKNTGYVYANNHAVSLFQNHFQGRKFMNPYAPAVFATHPLCNQYTNKALGISGEIGCSILATQGSYDLEIKTCCDTPCTTATTLTDRVSMK